MDDIHTHYDYRDNTSYVKNLRLCDIVSQNLTFELNDASIKPNKYLSVGIHPWDIDDFSLQVHDTDIFTFIRKYFPTLISHPKMFAIGECGLDKCIKTDFAFQKKVFICQLELSEEYKKPTIIHAVHSYNEIIELRKTLQPSQEWIIHGFSSNDIIAGKLVSLGCKISLPIGKSTDKLLKIKELLDCKNIFYETDTFFLSDKHTINETL